ncbi:hypothetical protein [Nocardia sp. R6R-6]|uniref:hypothetical protein n=1 Tax=Nocardia sp. R6R-6 TaxID=3459303 RepID=UPI00403DE01A
MSDDTTSPVETAVQRCHRYRRELGLPAVLTPNSRRIVLHADLIGAVVMPEQLGTRVAERLTGRGLLGPVIAHRESGRTTVLCGPPDGYEHEVSGVLLRLNVGVATRCIVLPSPADERTGYRQWSYLPRNSFRPSMRVVLDAVVEDAR